MLLVGLSFDGLQMILLYSPLLSFLGNNYVTWLLCQIQPIAEYRWELEILSLLQRRKAGHWAR
jgi:hypothetical protein